MDWKFLWQLTFIVGIIIFIIMFCIFSVKGLKDIIAIIKNKND